MTDAAPPRHPPRSPFLWGLFCACSWTWCIGMYLPVILIDRFGWPGFLAFAVPNVLGCGAMAFVVRSHERSRTMVSTHAPAMIAFSLVTVAFHVFFATWMLDELVAWIGLAWWMPLVVGAVVYTLGLVFSFLDDRDWFGLTIVTYAVSITAFVVIGARGFDRVAWEGIVPTSRLVALVPVIVFGFLLCPYLDLTFHRAVQASAAPRRSFVVFGVAFAIMLLLTVALWFSPTVWYGQAAAMLALGHILAQMIFTVGAHLREVRTSRAIAHGEWRWIVILLPLIAVAALPVARLMLDQQQAGERTYLMFMGCYGLAFPVYVLIAMATRRALKTRAAWFALIAFILASTPPYFVGFVHNRTIWLLPPLAVAMGWWLVRRRGMPATV